MEGMQPDECTPEVSWEVVWESDVNDEGVTRVLRRDQGDAISLAKHMTAHGFPSKVYRVEKTEVDF